MNAYFQLEMTPQGTVLHIFKQTYGGNSLNVNELAEYLNKKGIKFDLADLNKKIMQISDKGSIVLDDVKRYPEREMVVVNISADKMQAVCRFYPPSVGGNLLSREDIVNDLKSAKVIYGIDVDTINAFIENREYCTDLVLAKGKEVRHGTDASIEYFFNTDLRAKPTLKEDGSVDFFNLNAVNHIKKGDLLAKLTREDPGEKGIDVMNNFVKPRDVKKLMLKYGRHVLLNEDNTMAYSEVSGHVMLVEGKIFVSDVFQVENVDASTGDIIYDGSVKINGNVNSNFSVSATGNIEIAGVVEGAKVHADGNITIARGINGMGKSDISAGGNIISKYVENARLSAGGYIQTETIMHSTVSAKNEVIVDGKKGNISGSFVSARDTITVNNLGSAMGSDTVVQLGIDPQMKERMDFLNKEIENANKNLAQILPVLDAFKQKLAKGVKIPPETVKNIKDMSEVASKLMTSREEYTDELDEIKDTLMTESKSQVIVKNVIYAGTRICINDLQMTVKSDCRFCKFFKDKGDIRMSSL
ncbi:MAG: FapA family protein [Lachnospiraceae bacterium]|nr:FapA family protein [Lachnospiraceae bacterium]